MTTISTTDHRIASGRAGLSVLLRNRCGGRQAPPVLFVHGATYPFTATFDYARDDRFSKTCACLERSLCDRPFMRRYETADDFGLPQTAFNVCTFYASNTAMSW